MDKPKHTIEQVLEAIERGHTKAAAARVLGVSRVTIHSYVKRWKAVAEAFTEKKGELVDLAEGGLRHALEREDAWAITFTLRTLGKDEGYSERTDVNALIKVLDLDRLTDEQLERLGNGDDPFRVILGN